MNGLLFARWMASAVLALGSVAWPARTAAAQPADGAAAQRPTVGPQVIAQIRSIVESAMAEHDIPGLSVAVGIEGSLAWTEGFGMADLENQVPVTAQSVFRLASISKPVTAVAAMRLVEAGRLDLDAPVQTYVPEFPAKQAPITTRQLLGHLSGVRHYRSRSEMDSVRRFDDPVEALVQFADDELVARPGETFEYSTFGYVLAGAVVQRAAGKDFMQFVEECLSKAPTPVTILADDSRRLIPHRARGYTKSASGMIENCHPADTSNKVPGGGMCSRSQDLVCFGLALAKGELLSAESLETMWTSGRTADGKPTAYGLGWSISQEHGVRRVLHSGGQQGTSTCLVLYPQQKNCAAVMCNLEGAPATQIATRIAELLARENSRRDAHPRSDR